MLAGLKDWAGWLGWSCDALQWYIDPLVVQLCPVIDMLCGVMRNLTICPRLKNNIANYFQTRLKEQPRLIVRRHGWKLPKVNIA